jgi:hypothetical protein
VDTLQEGEPRHRCQACVKVGWRHLHAQGELLHPLPNYLACAKKYHHPTRFSADWESIYARRLHLHKHRTLVDPTQWSTTWSTASFMPPPRLRHVPFLGHLDLTRARFFARGGGGGGDVADGFSLRLSDLRFGFIDSPALSMLQNFYLFSIMSIEEMEGTRRFVGIYGNWFEIPAASA